MLIQNNFPLSEILWYKIGGKAKYLLHCVNGEDIKQALEFIKKSNITNLLICGLGSNLIVPDEDFNGAVIRIALENNSNNIQKKDNVVTIFAGTILDDLIKFSFENNLIGLEWAGGLPGTVGAGIRGNVGAFGHEIKESIISVNVLERKNGKYETKTLQANDLHFSYRNSLIKQSKNIIILSAEFQLKPASVEEVKNAKDIYTANINYRKTHHPIEYPTCGSVFKNITEPENVNKILNVWPDIKETVKTKWHGKVSMGYIINRLSFSEKRIGDMQVSSKHPNFIINLDKGKAKDVISLINEIKQKVQQTFNVVPEVEVEIVNGKEQYT